ncbi:MAG: hypothetical protein U0L85_11710 [Bacilli bacterium]|nr:hypothetical protein [Bacilli bacterium]
MEILEIVGIPYFKSGSGIHIKKENRGKFTEYCNGKVTQECIDKAKQSNNPTLKKRATFAENSRGWAKKHNTGGTISNPYLPKSIPFAKMGTVLPNDEDTYYPFYANPTLKEAIFQAFDEGYQGHIIDYKGKKYKAELSEADLAEYNNRKKSSTSQTQQQPVQQATPQPQRQQQQPVTTSRSKTKFTQVSPLELANKRWTDQEVIDYYVNQVLWPMENAGNTGFRNGKYYVYADNALPKNIGPGIAYTSNLGKKIDYNKGYTKEELDTLVRDYLSTLMTQVSDQMYGKYGDAYYDLPLGDRIVLLDLAYQIAPRNDKGNLPITGWPTLSQALIDGRYDIAEANVSTKQSQPRRKKMRQMLLGLQSLDYNMFDGM